MYTQARGWTRGIYLVAGTKHVHTFFCLFNIYSRFTRCSTKQQASTILEQQKSYNYEYAYWYTVFIVESGEQENKIKNPDRNKQDALAVHEKNE